jgi:peroxiredoxin
MRTRRFIPLHFVLVALILAPAFGFGVWSWTRAHPAPEADFTVIGGRALSLSQLRGQTVLLSFWATDCRPCLREMPALAQAYDELRPYGFEIVAVAMAHDTPARIYDFSQRFALPYPIALDLDGMLAQRFGVQAIPRSFLISPDGEIVADIVGEIDIGALRERVLQLEATS